MNTNNTSGVQSKVKQIIHDQIPIDCGDLVVRLYKISDVPLFYKYTSDKELTRYLVCSVSESYKAATRFVLGMIDRYTTEYITRFIIADKETDKLVGAISLYISKTGAEVELGYWVGKEHWGKGYMTKVLISIINKLKEIIYVNKVFITVNANNMGSIRAADKAGMIVVSSSTTEQGKILKMEINISEV